VNTWAASPVSQRHDGEVSAYRIVTPARPVRVQAANDIAATCPYSVAKSFKALA
jgi:hypothetical protein